MRILAPLLLLVQVACSPPASSDAGDDAAAVPSDATNPAPDAAVIPPVEADWRARPIYMVLTDRFANGDSSNDDLGVPGCFDPQAERSFHGGDLAGLRQRADYLAELGVGTLWITPLYEQVGCGYHGYWADYQVPDPRLVEPRLGDDSEVDALIESLHARGMGLMLDMIVNHSGRGATIVGQHPDWFHSSSNCAELGPTEIYCPLSGLPDFAHENAEVATFVTDISAAWLRRFEVDGVRMDTAKHVTREYFRDHWFPRMRAERPGLVVIAEVFDASGAGVYEEYLDAGFDSAFHFALRQGLIDVFGRDASTNVLADRVRDSVETLGLDRALSMALFLDNHDVPRWTMDALGDAGAVLRRYRLALTALFTLPGVPQLYYGDELGMTGTWPDNRRDMPAWAWTAAGRAGEHAETLPDPAGTFDLVQRLGEIRRTTPALWRGSYVELWRQNAGPPTYVFFRGHGDSRVIVVLHNGDAPSGELAVRIATAPHLSEPDRAAMPDGLQLVDVLGAGAPPTLRIEAGNARVTMPPRSAAIYRVP